MQIGSFNPSELSTMMNLLSSNKYDFVFASRYEKAVRVTMIQ